MLHKSGKHILVILLGDMVYSFPLSEALLMEMKVCYVSCSDLDLISCIEICLSYICKHL